MDFQILNTEIRSALPTLEKAAIFHELNVHNEEKKVNEVLNNIIKLPDFFENNVKDFENSIEDACNAKDKLKFLMTADIEEKRKEKKALSIEVGKKEILKKNERI